MSNSVVYDSLFAYGWLTSDGILANKVNVTARHVRGYVRADGHGWADPVQRGIRLLDLDVDIEDMPGTIRKNNEVEVDAD